MGNVRNLNFSTDYSIDKIVGVYEGSINTSTAPTLGGYLPYKSIVHGFDRPVFVYSQFSKDNETWSDMNSRSPFDGNATMGIAYSTDTNIVIVAAETGVIYYRLFATWIDKYDATDPLISTTLDSRSQLYFDTTANIQKIYEQDMFMVPNGVTVTNISHGLGYAPNVLVYNEMLPGQIWPANWGGLKNVWIYDFNMVECRTIINDSELIITTTGSVSGPSSRVFYRIYYDE